MSTIYKINDADFRGVSLSGFYDNVAIKYVKHELSEDEKYECRNICVANNIQDAWFDYYEAEGCSDSEVAMLLLMCGPKVNAELNDNEVEILDDFIIKRGVV